MTLINVKSVMLTDLGRFRTSSPKLGEYQVSSPPNHICKPSFYQRLQARKAAPNARIEVTKASIAIPFPPIRPEEIHVQWCGEDYVDGEGIEMEEVIKKPVERGWGIWYQADVIARRLQEWQRQGVKEGETIGAEESLRVLRWMDQAREQAGILYNTELEKL